MAGWIVEKFRDWGDCDNDVESRFTKDELLTNISIYWFTETINSSMRLYYESKYRPLHLIKERDRSRHVELSSLQEKLHFRQGSGRSVSTICSDGLRYQGG